jgi:hypothetical protein
MVEDVVSNPAADAKTAEHCSQRSSRPREYDDDSEIYKIIQRAKACWRLNITIWSAII